MLKNNVEVNKYMKKISIRNYVTREEIENLLDCASRGSDYWSENDLGYESEVKKVLVTTRGITIKDIEAEPNKYFSLNLVKIKKGLKVMANKYPKHFANFIAEDYDAITGDVFLQCCLFGEVIYS